MTLKQNWTVAISWVQSLKWRTRQIYQDLKKALEITSHFISVNLIYKAVSTECGTLKLTFIQLKTPQPIRFADYNSIDEVANARRGKSARLPSVFPLIGWASRTRFFDPLKKLNAKESNCGISFGTYWKCSVFNSHKFRQCDHNTCAVLSNHDTSTFQFVHAWCKILDIYGPWRGGASTKKPYL